MKNALILLAGGAGKRMGISKPKQFLDIGSENIIEYLLTNLDSKIFDLIVIAIKNKDKLKYTKSLKLKFKQHNIEFIKSGVTRQISSKNSLIYLKKYNPKKVLIHDSARPLASNSLFKKIIKNLDKHNTSIPYVQYNDLIKTKRYKGIQNKEIIHIQTPQGFIFKDVYKAHISTNILNFKDDSSLLENFGNKINFTKGDLTNIKITKKEDLEQFERLKVNIFRSGIGYDIHKLDLSSKKQLTLCGIKIDHAPLIGHSDADVGYHAICDSILGSLSLKDIGFHFNNKNKKWKNANSEIFMIFCLNKLIEKKFKIINLDINFICESPNISKIQHLMKSNLSKILKISQNIISIKATTNEKIGMIGRGEGIAAESIIQIKNV